MQIATRGNRKVLYTYSPGVKATSGKAVPLLFHHGVGLTSDAWVPWAVGGQLEDRSLLAIEMRGHGAAADEWSGGCTLDDFVEDAAIAIEDAGFKSCDFVGESFGGTIGLALAARTPGLVRSLTLISTAYEGSQIPTLDEWPELVRSGRWAEWMTERRLGRQSDAVLHEWVTSQNRQAAPDAVLAVANILQETNLRADLVSIECPTHIIAPTESPFVGTDRARELLVNMPESTHTELTYVPGALHGIVISHPEVCLVATLSFIERHVIANIGSPSNRR